MGDRLDDVRTRDEHVRRLLHHENEIGDGGRVDGAARARPHDGRELGDHPRRERVAQEDVGVAGQRHDAFLDPGAARIVQPDDGHARLHGQVHDLADLPRVGFREGAAEHREVLGEDKHRPPVDAPGARDDAVARDPLLVHAEVPALMDDEPVDLREGALVEEELQALPRGLLAGTVLPGDALRPSGQLGRLVPAVEFLEAALEGHGRRLSWHPDADSDARRSIAAGSSESQ